MRRWKLIAGAAVAVAAWATWIALTSHHGSASDNDTFAVLLPLNGLTYTWTGLYAWQRRPAERLGPLMVALGFAFMAQGLLFADTALPFTLGMMVGPLWGALFVHLVLSAPDGRLRTTAARVVVAATYVTFVPLQVAVVVVSDPADLGECADGCPSNALRITHWRVLSDALVATWTVVAVGVALASIVVLARRWHAATAAERRALAPTLIGGATLAALFVIAQVSGSHLAGFLAQIVLALIPFAFLAGLARAHVSRAAGVRALVERLGARPGPEALRAALADALGDPGLTLAFWLPDQGRYADADGAPVELPAGDGPRAATEIEYEGRRVAAIIHDRGLCDDRDAVLAAGAAAALTLENQRLDAELRARLDELRASRGRLVARRRRRAPAARARPPRRRAARASSRVALHCVSRAKRLPPDSEAARCSTPRSPSCASASRSCASSPAASTRRCSPTAGSTPALRSARRTARRCRSRSRATSPSGCPGRSRRPPTSSPPRRWRTSRSTPSARAASIARRAQQRHAGRRRRRRRPRRRRPRARLGAARPVRPRRRPRRAARRREPGGRRDARARRDPVRVRLRRR